MVEEMHAFWKRPWPFTKAGYSALIYEVYPQLTTLRKFIYDLCGAHRKCTGFTMTKKYLSRSGSRALPATELQKDYVYTHFRPFSINIAQKSLLLSFQDLLRFRDLLRV